MKRLEYRPEALRKLKGIKEDFMWKLFGVQTRSQDTDDYWSE